MKFHDGQVEMAQKNVYNEFESKEGEMSLCNMKL